MSLIRKLEADEVGRVIDLGKMFYAESKLPGVFNPEHFAACWSELIRNGMGAIFVVDSNNEMLGAVGGVGFPDFNTGDMAVAESFWFMRPNSRAGFAAVRLFHAYEDWAKNEMKAKVIFMTFMNHLTPNSLRRLYEKRGYAEVETHFLKEVK